MVACLWHVVLKGVDAEVFIVQSSLFGIAGLLGRSAVDGCG